MASFSWPVITSANPSVGGTGSAAPSSATEVGGVNPSGDLEALQLDASGNLLVSISDAPGEPFHVIVDSSALPTGAATEATLSAANAKLPATLGQKAMAASLAVAIASDQSGVPVSGTVAATQSGTWNINNVSGTVSLPTGAATETTLSSINTKTPALGQAAMAASVPVVIASNQTAVSVSAAQSGTWNITNVSGTVSLPTGASTEASLAKLTLTQGSTTSGQTGALIMGAVTTAAPSYTTAQTSPLSLDTSGALRVSATITNTVIAASSSSVTSVASSASSVSLLASNSSRKNATFFNDSTSVLYLKLGATASTTSYTVQIPSNGYYELPGVAVYTGAIDGIWSSANGNARITELS